MAKVILVDDEGKEIEYTTFILFARRPQDGEATRCAANLKDVSANDLKNIAETITEAIIKHILPLTIQKAHQEESKN